MRGPVVVTGAAGFVGAAFCEHLRAQAIPFVGVVRSTAAAARPGPRHGGATRDGAMRVGVSGECGGRLVGAGDFADADWDSIVDGAGVVVHLSALAHRRAAIDESAYQRANVEVTRRVLDASIRRGVRRLVLASSVKVLGERSDGAPFRDQDPPRPADAYARSKRAAEGLVEAARDRLETVVLRLPLVYGPGVGANFLALMRAVDGGWPLPLASIRNRRSLLFSGNLASALAVASSHPEVAGASLLLRDGDDVSTPALVERIAAALGRRARLFALPPAMLRAAGRLLGRRGTVDSLVASLAVDDSRFRAVTGWRPPYDLEAGLRRTVEWYRASAVREQSEPARAV